MRFFKNHPAWKAGLCALCLMSAMIGCAHTPKTQKGSKSAESSPAVSDTQDPNKALGKSFLREALRQYRFVKDPEVVAAVNRVGRRLVEAAGSDPSTYHFLVVKGAEPNAFAIPGGYIFVFDSLLEKMRDEQELAGVLAHEIAHVRRNHFFKDQGKSAAIDLATIAAILLSRGNLATAAVAQATNISTQLQFSRENESEADEFAVGYLREAGYDPDGLLRFLSTLAEHERLNTLEIPAYLSTHPGLEGRVEELDRQLRAAGQEPVGQPPAAPAVQWDRVVIAIKLTDRPPVEIAGLLAGLPSAGTGGMTEEHRHYLTGLGYLRSGRFQQAVPEYEAALAFAPEHPVYLTDLARCHLQLQEFGPARARAEQAVRADPDHPEGHLLLGQLEAQNERWAEAIGHYHRALAQRPEDALIHFHLSQAYQKTEQPPHGAYHLGRFLRLSLEPDKALSAFRRAKELMRDEPELGRLIQQEMDELRREGI
jgi:predicted Zn-dependent protease